MLRCLCCRVIQDFVRSLARCQSVVWHCSVGTWRRRTWEGWPLSRVNSVAPSLQNKAICVHRECWSTSSFMVNKESCHCFWSCSLFYLLLCACLAPALTDLTTIHFKAHPYDKAVLDKSLTLSEDSFSTQLVKMHATQAFICPWGNLSLNLMETPSRKSHVGNKRNQQNPSLGNKKAIASLASPSNMNLSQGEQFEMSPSRLVLGFLRNAPGGRKSVMCTSQEKESTNKKLKGIDNGVLRPAFFTWSCAHEPSYHQSSLSQTVWTRSFE